MRPALVAASHGTASLDGQRAVRGLVDAVIGRLPDVEVREAFVDVQPPEPAQVLRDIGGPSVVVPLLLSAGYHVYVDLTDAVAGAPSARLAAALGPDPRLVDLLAHRVESVVIQPDDAVILVAAGSSEPLAVNDCHAMTAALAERVGHAVQTAFLSAAQPRVDAAVTAARANGADRVIAVTYLLAPGYFADQTRAAGADVTTSPLLVPGEAVPDGLAEIVVDRYQAALA